jgi:phage head maturation protease
VKIKGLPIVRSGSLYRADEDELEEGTLGRLVVRFSPFDTWYEINSWWEGRFLEKTAQGAFKKTAREAKRSDGLYSTKVLYDHGTDFNIGNKMLAVPDRFEEANEDGYHGPVIEGDLLDTSYNRDLLPGLKRGAYGSSFMFSVIRDSWDHEPDASDYNPDGLPERTVQEVRTFEAGPVTWPASPTATAGMRGLVGRSGTDAWMERLAARNSTRHEDLVRSYEATRAYYKTPDYKPSTPTLDSEPEPRRQVDEAAQQRAAILRSRRLDLMKRSY